ncbi:MAG: DUF4214 domain-containing protein [Paracoccaceae bacterium]
MPSTQYDFEILVPATGDVLTAELQIDLDAVPFSQFADRSSYRVEGFAQFRGERYEINVPSSVVGVGNDEFSLLPTPPDILFVTLIFARDFQTVRTDFQLIDTSGTAFDDSRPPTDLSLADFDQIGQLSVFSGSRLLNGEFQSFSVTLAPEIGDGLSVEEAQVVAYLYATALNRNGPFELGGLNFWIDAREDGLSQRNMAEQFLDNPEFRSRFGDVNTLTDEEIVDTFYLNALDRPRGPGEGQFWVDRLAAPDVETGDVLLAFATAPENIQSLTFVEDLAETAPGFWEFV